MTNTKLCYMYWLLEHLLKPIFKSLKNCSNYDFMDDNIDTRKRQSHQSLPQKGEKKPQQSACGTIFTLKGNYFISQDVT